MEKIQVEINQKDLIYILNLINADVSKKEEKLQNGELFVDLLRKYLLFRVNSEK